jgi:hypothetical protein
MLTADRDQARYFYKLLGRKRAELHEQIDELHVELTRLDRVQARRPQSAPNHRGAQE